jgi:hypothetical protein
MRLCLSSVHWLRSHNFQSRYLFQQQTSKLPPMGRKLEYCTSCVGGLRTLSVPGVPQGATVEYQVGPNRFQYQRRGLLQSREEDRVEILSCSVHTKSFREWFWSCMSCGPVFAVFSLEKIFLSLCLRHFFVAVCTLRKADDHPTRMNRNKKRRFVRLQQL